MRHIFIINPKAGKDRNTKRLEANIRKLDEPYEIIYTARSGDARRIAQKAAESGETVRIYACGGDGTLNEVVNGAAGHDNAAVTNVPIGTANDFLKLFGKNYRKRFLDVAALSEGPQAAMDLIDCNGFLGIDIVCTGLDARIAVDKDKYTSIPFVRGMGAYVLSLISNVFRGIARPMVVECGDLNYDGETTIICVCNGRYYGGGFMPVADNMPDDGLIEVLVVPKISRLTLFRLVGKYGAGRFREFPDLVWYRQGFPLTVRSSQELVAVIDGEEMRCKEFHIGLSDKKVNFFYPSGMNYNPK